MKMTRNEEDDDEAIKRLDRDIAALRTQLNSIINERKRLLSSKAKKRPATDDGRQEPPFKLVKTRSQLNLDTGASMEVITEHGEPAGNIENGDDTSNKTDKTLVNTESLEDQDKTETQNVWKEVQGKRVPPIYVYKVTDWVSLSSMLDSMCTEPFTAKNGSENIKIQAKNKEDYKTITSTLENENIEYHSYQLEKNAYIKVVIKGIPCSTTAEKVQSNLLEMDFKVKNVTQMKDTFQTLLPIYIVQIEKNEKAKDIYGINTLFRCKVKVEPFRKRKGELIQCHRCQRFGHTSQNCRTQPRCLKCASEHFTFESKKKPTSPANCINCGQNHPANYKGCAYYLKAKEDAVAWKLKDKPEIKKVMEGKQPRHFTPRMSFAEIAKKSQSHAKDKIAQTNKSKNTIPPQKETPRAEIGNSYQGLMLEGNKLSLEEKVNYMMTVLAKICSQVMPRNDS